MLGAQRNEAAVGHGGLALSSGERQLVALARVSASDAPVVVLDEATAHLDPAAEAGRSGRSPRVAARSS